MKPIYFLSDAHLGSLAVPHQRMQERRLVRFLDSIKEKAAAVYLLGDMFDFWYEYKYVVPKGFTRFLGKISELTDMGVEVHYFTGNHDIWAYEYLVLFTKKYIQYHSNVDYFIYGHRHIEVDLQLTKKARMVILGDWITQFSYIVWDGEHLLMSQYIEGESQP